MIVAGFPRPLGQFRAPETKVAGLDGQDLALTWETVPGFSGGPVLRDEKAIGIIYGTEAGGYGSALIADTVVSYLRGLKVPLGGGEKEMASKPKQATIREPPETRGGQRVNPKDGLTYVWIPPGSFVMGCTWPDRECTAGEKPPHAVVITQGSWLGQTEVTQAAYQRIMGQNPSFFRGDDIPVQSVNWSEARLYCHSIGMRLPSEAEWEYAARGGAKEAEVRYGEIDEIAWTADNSGGTPLDSRRLMWEVNDIKRFFARLEANGNQPHRAGTKKANAYGLHDMLGNLMEWVEDYFGDYQAGVERDPLGPRLGARRVVRGGSWLAIPGACRASSRSQMDPAQRQVFIGFRCAGELR